MCFFAMDHFGATFQAKLTFRLMVLNEWFRCATVCGCVWLWLNGTRYTDTECRQRFPLEDVRYRFRAKKRRTYAGS